MPYGGPPRPRRRPFFFFPISHQESGRFPDRRALQRRDAREDPKRSQNRRAEHRPPQEANSRTATKTMSHSSRPRPERSSPRPLGNPLTLPGLSPWLRSAERLSSYPGQQQETHFEQPHLPWPHQSVAARTRSEDPGPVGRQRLPAGQNTNYGYLNYVLAPVKLFVRVCFPQDEPTHWRPWLGSHRGMIG
jgi:hypothetical protein